jgi:adenylate cyclase
MTVSGDAHGVRDAPSVRDASGRRGAPLKRVVAVGIIGLAAASLSIAASRFELVRALERQTLDLRFRTFATPSPATDRILVIDIDERSIQSLEPDFGRWPWPRDAHAAIVEYVRRAGAKVIAFDVLFSERTTRREVAVADLERLRAAANALEARPTSAGAARLKDEIAKLDPRAGDDALTSSSEAAGNVLYAMIFREDAGEEISPSGVERPIDAATESAPSSRWRLDQSFSKALAEGALGSRSAYPSMTLPLPSLKDAAAGLGHTNLHPDPDGPARSTYPVLGCGEIMIPSLPVSAAALALGVPVASVRVEPGRLVIGPRAMPTDREGRMPILYQARGNGEAAAGRLYNRVSYADVLLSYLVQGTDRPPPISPDVFRDKVVLIGTSATGLFDLRATPFSAVTPGVEIHCHVLDNILAGRYLAVTPAWFEPLVTLAVAALVALAAGVLHPLTGLGVSSALLLAYVSGTAAAFSWARTWVEVVAPVMAGSFAYVGVAVYRYRIEQSEKRVIRGAMGRYLPAAVLEEILSNPEKLKLGGERRTVTVLFSDVAGFTTLSDQLPPEEIAVLLNEYLTRMTECVFAQSGTLDKFIGDAIMAEFGAPIEQADHAARACRAAIEMRDALGELQKRWRRDGRPVLDCRIGIGTGDAIVGNMGSDQLFDYTAIGRIVNTAARLEPLCKDFGATCLVSSVTAESAARFDGDLILREIALVRVKGTETPQSVHELIGRRGAIDADAMNGLEAFADGLARFRSGAFAEAKAAFARALDARPGDGPARKLLELCEAALASPPEGEWTGVYEQLSK